MRIGIDRPDGSAVGTPHQLADSHDVRGYHRTTFADFAAAQHTGDPITVLAVRMTTKAPTASCPARYICRCTRCWTASARYRPGPLWVHFASGSRAGIAVSLLDRAGHYVVLIDDEHATAVTTGQATDPAPSSRITPTDRRRRPHPTEARHEYTRYASPNPDHRRRNGIGGAARLRHAQAPDVGLIDPADTHYYQPLWTLVGGSCAPAKESARPQASIMPKGVAWIRDSAASIDADNQVVTTGTGTRVSYDHLVVCPVIQLDWATIPGMAEGMDTPSVSSNYTYATAPKTWELIRNLRSGTAVFTMPAGPIKCAGAPRRSPISPPTTGAGKAYSTTFES